MQQKQMHLKEYIDHVGAEKLAGKLGVHISTVRHWRRMHCLPKAEQMHTLVKLSRGALSYQTIIDPYFKNVRG